MDKVADLLEKLAVKLGTTVQYLWPLMVKRTQWDWIGDMAATVFLLSIGLAIFHNGYKRFKITPEYKNSYGVMVKDYSELDATILIVGIVITFVSVLFVMGNISNVSALVCPEAQTFHNLLKMMK